MTMSMAMLLQFLNRTLPFCQEADVEDAMSAMTLVEKVCQPTSSHLPVHSNRILEGAQEYPDIITFTS